MLEQPITDESFLLVAMHHYDNRQCTSISEFEEDLKRFAYLKKLFSRYKEQGELKERLIVNHLIILHNVFGIITPDLLFFKIDKQYWDILSTFLFFLNIMPHEIPEFGVKLEDIKLDETVLQTLRKL